MRRLSSIGCCCASRGTPNSSKGSRILSTTLRHGSRLGSWNTYAVRGEPTTSTRPVVGSARCAINRRIVVLPQPDGPTIETNSPRRTEKSTASSTGG